DSDDSFTALAPAPPAPLRAILSKGDPVKTVGDMLLVLAKAGTEVEPRRTLLLGMGLWFLQLVNEVTASGKHPAVAQRLDAAWQQLRGLVRDSRLAAGEVHAIWDEVVAALTEYQAATEPPDRRERFWA